LSRQQSPQYDDDDDDVDARDDPQERDVAAFGDDDGADLIACPACDKQVWEMADRCSFCGAWITPEKSPVGMRTIAIAGVLVVLMLVALFFVI
jgi:hypothetical protein